MIPRHKDLTAKQKGFILGEGKTLHSVAIIGFTLAFQVI